jgi:hypothetical protein
LVKNEEEDDVKEGDQNAPISLKETSILTSFSGILFAFLLRIATSPPKEFSLFDRFVILMALYSSCIAISFFIMPAISHQLLHARLHLERYMKRMQTFMKIGSVAAIIAVFLSLGIALSALFGREIAYVFAALPFVIASMVMWKK